ncbi:MAG: hydantoinase/oxoprolinase family protein [Thermomicrobiales bacterium]
MTRNHVHRLAIDIGGTFTDVVLLDAETHQLSFVKATTTPADRAVGFFAGIEAVLAAARAAPESVQTITHGSTVATNAVLEGKGSRLGLITTLGFRDMLEIGRAYIPGIFTNFLRWQKPERLVPLERVRAVPERVVADGSVIAPLDEAATRRAIQELLDDGIAALAISLLHSYANPAHERRIEAMAREMAPGLFVSRSSAVLPEYREYERTMTTVLNAYVMPTVASYLEHIQQGLAAKRLPRDIAIVRSDAGVMSLTTALERPVNTVLSGPAGGVLGASAVAAAAGYAEVVSLDMGGTSTDVCLSSAGEPRLSTDTWVSHYPVKVPIIDITTIGAGGGSIATVSATGAVRVGPQSAGSDPGPVCYGRGGTQPTVTDANLVLGRLPDELAGGEVHLDRAGARQAIAEQIANPLGISVEDAALGIIRIVDENMLGALRVVSVQRGIDPRELALVPFGGAGPMHGAELARLAGISTMLVPPHPGVLSALGFLLADVKQVFTLTRVGLIGHLDVAAYEREVAGLIDAATRWLEREGIPEGDRAIEIAVDLRYRGQAYEIPIRVRVPLDAATWQDAAARYHAEHKRRYGYDQPRTGVEAVTLRVTAIGALPKPEFRRQEIVDPAPAPPPLAMQPVVFAQGTLETPLYDRDTLTAGVRLTGPAVVVQPDCTTLLHPGQTARIDGFGNLVVATGG